MADGAAYDDVTFGFGVMYEVNARYGSRFYGQDVKLNDYIKNQSGWQTVAVPMSIYSSLVGHDYNLPNNGGTSAEADGEVPWDLMGGFYINIPQTIENANLEITNLRFASKANNDCSVAFNIYDEDGNEVTALTAGAKVKVVAAAKNEKTGRDETMLCILALYKNGIMEKVVGADANILRNSNEAIETEYITLPADITGYTLRGFLWNDFTTIQPCVDSIEINC